MGPLEPALLDRLRTYNTPTVSNAIEVFDVRPRNEGFMRPEIRCIFPQHGRHGWLRRDRKDSIGNARCEGRYHSSQSALERHYESAQRRE
jgi:hypothetical protein